MTPEPSPLTHDLDDIHEPQTLPEIRRVPRPEDVVLAMHLEWGIPIHECKMRLCAMNFESVEL